MKITNVLWNNNLSTPSSQLFISMKAQLEREFNKTFCETSIITNVTGVSESCYVEVSSFTRGSVNVFFQINEVTKLPDDFKPTDSETLKCMHQAITSIGIGKFETNESSVMISE